MSQLLIAKELNQLLQYWEDCNLSGEFKFQVALKTKGIKNTSADLDALIGSELNRLGLFARSIPGYQNLRKILAGHPYTHQTNFLPRIPKDMRDIFKGSHDLFLDHEFVKTPVHISQYFLKWNETRKACVVEDAIPIPTIDLRKENWLDKLPYHAFFLKLASPFVFQDPGVNLEWSLDSFLICNDGDYVRIMSWPREIERFLFTDKERKDIRDGITDLIRNKIPKKNTVMTASKIDDWFLSNLAVQKGTSNVRIVQGPEANILHSDIYNPEKWVDPFKTIPELYVRLRIMMETINGFCKLMATLPAKPTAKVIESSQNAHSPAIPRQWFELPMQLVDYFHTDTVNEIIVIHRGSGSEKSPHVRRGHTRRMVKKDGRIIEIWIEETVIRADKLITEQLQGGALKIQ